MSANITELLLKFNSKDVSKSSLMPLMAHAVLDNISAQSIKKYLQENGYKISLKSLQRWRREAAVWLGLQQTKPGRPSYEEEKQARQEWHEINGYPTLEMFVKGWQPQAKSVVNEPTKRVENGGGKVEKTGPSKPDKFNPKSPSSRATNTPPKIDLSKMERPVRKKKKITVN